MLVCVRNRQQEFPSCLTPILLSIADHIFRKKVPMIIFTPNSACNTHFQFHNHELFEEGHCLKLNPLIPISYSYTL